MPVERTVRLSTWSPHSDVGHRLTGSFEDLPTAAGAPEVEADPGRGAGSGDDRVATLARAAEPRPARVSEPAAV
jgi:hypothetical protein